MIDNNAEWYISNILLKSWPFLYNKNIPQINKHNRENAACELDWKLWYH